MKTLFKKLKNGIQSVKAWLGANLSPGQKNAGRCHTCHFCRLCHRSAGIRCCVCKRNGLVAGCCHHSGAHGLFISFCLPGHFPVVVAGKDPFLVSGGYCCRYTGHNDFFSIRPPLEFLLILGTMALCCAFIGGALQQFRKGRWVRSKALHKVLTLFCSLQEFRGLPAV